MDGLFACSFKFCVRVTYFHVASSEFCSKLLILISPEVLRTQIDGKPRCRGLSL